MTVNKTFQLEIKARVKNEKIGIILLSVAIILLYFPFVFFRLLGAEIPLYLKIILIIVSIVVSIFPLYLNITTLGKLKNIIVELTETDNSINAKLYSGDTINFNKSLVDIEEFSWKVRQQEFTFGRNIMQDRKKYFIPDSEFQKPPAGRDL